MVISNTTALAAEKKKTILASCLIALMAFMWFKVLSKKTPQAAKAAITAQKAINNEQKRQLKISFIELPRVKGRNDVLTRDFFAGNEKNLDGVKNTNLISRDGDEEVIERIAEKLKLEAIGLGENSQAFINGKLLSVGDKLLVGDGVNTYECEVVGIEEDTVFVKFGEAEIQLRLAQGAKTTIER